MSRLSKPSVDSVDSVDSCSCKCAPGSGLLPTNNCAAAAASTTPHHESGHRTPATADTPATVIDQDNRRQDDKTVDSLVCATKVV